MAQSDTLTRIKPSEAVKEPPMFKVIYLNDNQTTMDFVIESLVEFFDYSPLTAEKITANFVSVDVTNKILAAQDVNIR